MGRWGLVLGGGGVLGAAWMVGALTALHEATGLEPRDADLIVGTSAGSLLAALIGAGVSVEELCEHQLGNPARSGPLADLDWDYDTATGGSKPPARRFGMGSWALVRQGPGRLRKVPPSAVLAALMPEGKGSLESVGRLVADLQGLSGRTVDDWSPHPGVRVVAMDYENGRRVCFGAPGSPAGLPDAVMASCAIPGWYAPVVIGGDRYVDGGAASATNIDLAAGHDLDRVYAFAPMATFVIGAAPTTVAGRLEKLWRQRVTRRALHETEKLHRTGTDVTVLAPGAEDLAVIGTNLMNVTRRRAVLDTALVTAREALSDPEVLEHLIDRVHADLATPEVLAGGLEYGPPLIGREGLPAPRRTEGLPHDAAQGMTGSGSHADGATAPAADGDESGRERE